MLRIYVLVAAAVVAFQSQATTFLKTRADEARKDERGIGTLEMVVIGLGLLLLATAAIAVIKAAVDSRLNNIK